jgi:hypothetical protein
LGRSAVSFPSRDPHPAAKITPRIAQKSTITARENVVWLEEARLCPVSRWRRSLRWQARFHTAVPERPERAERAICLSNGSLVKMFQPTVFRFPRQQMWPSPSKRLTNTAAFDVFSGWIRTAEVTKWCRQFGASAVLHRPKLATSRRRRTCGQLRATHHGD